VSPIDEHSKTRLTTREVLAAEQTLAMAAQGLAATSRDVTTTWPASERLMSSSAELTTARSAGDSRLKVVTGVPSAGKTTLITEVAAAYRDAGYNVRAVSIANSAVDVLRRETDVPARSIAK